METNTMIYLGILIAGAILSTAVYKKAFKAKGGMRTAIMVLGIIGLVYGTAGFLGSAGYIELGSASGVFFTATGVQPVTTDTTTTTPSVDEGVEQRIIDTLKAVDAKEMYSNKYDQVAGTLRFYDAGTDPSSPNANAIDTITVSAGTGSSTNAVLKTNTQYRVVFDGSTNYYSKDYGIQVIADENYNPSTGTASFAVGELMNISTFSTFLNETDTADGTINGQSSMITGTDVLGNSTNELVYDRSVGTGQFYVKPTIGAEGANKGLKDAVLCFEQSSTNPIAGNEISAFTSQLISGTDFGIPSDLLNYWANQECVSLGDISSGASGDYKFTITVDATAWGSSDSEWYIGVDDLGGFYGKDVALNNGATLDRTLFSTQA